MSIRQSSMSGVTVEWDEAKHPQLNVKAGPLSKAAALRSAKGDDEFIPARIVIDLKLDLGDAQAEKVALDNVHLKIPYKGEQPIVGWWNGSRWVKFQQVKFADSVADITLPSPWPIDPPIGCSP
jgi:hypothetical protein